VASDSDVVPADRSFLAPVRSLLAQAAGAGLGPAFLSREPVLAPPRVSIVPRVTTDAGIAQRDPMFTPRTPSRTLPVATSMPSDEVRFPVAAPWSVSASAGHEAPPLSPLSPLPPLSPLLLPPLVTRSQSRRPAVETLPFLRRKERTVETNHLQETITRRIEETLQRRVFESVEKVVARELATDSVLVRRLGDRIYGGLYDSLVLERERLGRGYTRG
jgi:hypothetical protein